MYGVFDVVCVVYCGVCGMHLVCVVCLYGMFDEVCVMYCGVCGMCAVCHVRSICDVVCVSCVCDVDGVWCVCEYSVLGMCDMGSVGGGYERGVMYCDM